eukprot:351140-Chlamydomonas_euryale.AAC.48
MAHALVLHVQAGNEKEERELNQLTIPEGGRKHAKKGRGTTGGLSIHQRNKGSQATPHAPAFGQAIPVSNRFKLYLLGLTFTSSTHKHTQRNLAFSPSPCAVAKHPDKHPDNVEEAKAKFLVIQKAYDSLMSTDEEEIQMQLT